MVIHNTSILDPKKIISKNETNCYIQAQYIIPDKENMFSYFLISAAVLWRKQKCLYLLQVILRSAIFCIQSFQVLKSKKKKTSL